MLKNQRLIHALQCKTTDCTPIWIMRQAGRYLPEYRALRARAGDFLSLCKTPELSCEATLQPVQRFTELDAAILFSDILTVPDAMGLGLYFTEGEGPKFERPLRTMQDIEQLPSNDLALDYVYQSIELVQKELDQRIPLIGFCGSPWTLATYMIEGQATRTFSLIKTMLYNEPALLHRLLDKLTDALVDYLNAQIAAGVQAVQIFDSWGGVLTPEAYREFSLAPMTKIIQRLQGDVPVILFSKGAHSSLESMVNSGAQALGVDWTISMHEARSRVGARLEAPRVALQGNLDPTVMYASPEVIQAEAKKVLESYGKGVGHVFNLGHGIHPNINPEHVAALIEAVHGFSKEMLHG